MQNQLERLKSSITGLDDVLCGGFIAGGSYIIQGRPGSGKTILANQVAFAQAKAGYGVLYVTLLAESHERLFQSLSTLEFYDAAAVGDAIRFVSVLQTLREEGLSDVVALLRREMARQAPAMMIIDGLLSVRDRGDAALDVKTFVAELQAHAAFSCCTVFFLTSAAPGDANPEHTMVDGVVELSEETVGFRAIRRLQVAKSRGSSALRGFHEYQITDEGLTVYPRLEAFSKLIDEESEITPVRVPSGVKDLDASIGGGFPATSVTLLMGPSGSGKTAFGLSFLSLATPAEPAVMMGFAETPARLAMKARALGIDLSGLLASGALRIIWCPLSENLQDKLAYDLLELVKETRARRVFIDGFGGFERSSAYPGRIVEFFAALAGELRSLGATTIATWEMRNMFGYQLDSPAPEFAGTIDNLLLLRQTEIRAELKRLLAIIKLRDGKFDAGLHVVEITDRGVMINGRFENADGIITGIPRSAEPASK